MWDLGSEMPLIESMEEDESSNISSSITLNLESNGMIAVSHSVKLNFQLTLHQMT